MSSEIVLDSTDYLRFGIGVVAMIVFGLAYWYASTLETDKIQEPETPWEHGPDVSQDDEIWRKP